ncbi:hypothetical protein Celaphus_00003282 [Cervus elaphus hippelaphus]|uniref:Uncharacterized protein n=1 Tax=Cervus elaphus hippelaphus TaxID=46360 RepID=A0A212D1L0_CEREH|nr:hypothetical protein Celaphus_00003282 [Cervus elaphus hippelaphus]
MPLLSVCFPALPPRLERGQRRAPQQRPSRTNAHEALDRTASVFIDHLGWLSPTVWKTVKPTQGRPRVSPDPESGLSPEDQNFLLYSQVGKWLL